MLRELAEDGHLEKRRKTYRDPDKLPPVSVLQVGEPSSDGDLYARPIEWQGDGPEPTVLLIARATDPALGAGERILARVQIVRGEDHAYEGRLIRRIGTNPRKVLGLFRKHAEGGRILPIDKGTSREWRVAAGATQGARDGELVEAEPAGPKDSLGLPRARILARLGDPSQPRAVSLIAIHQHGIPDSFSDDTIGEADAMTPADLTGRENLTDLPLVTIDPSDARDHDDAVFAEADPDPKNKGGFVLWVAIADVAHYVRPGSALDREAWERGNSTYFPDRVVPMLPDRLSGDLCSLHEGVPRACIVARMIINAAGEMTSSTFLRALMKSPASLHYEEVQAAIDGAPNDKTAPLLEPVLKPLYAAYGALTKARARRAPLELDLPERQIELDPKGVVRSVAFKDRLTAHKLIEEFMVLANVAAAKTLVAKRTPLLLRGALIAAHGWGDDGLTPDDTERLRSTAEHISTTERRSMEAERDTTDRYLAAYLADRVGTELTGRISGIQRFGAFVRLDETGADGLLPMREIGNWTAKPCQKAAKPGNPEKPAVPAFGKNPANGPASSAATARAIDREPSPIPDSALPGSSFPRYLQEKQDQSRFQTCVRSLQHR